MLTPKTSAIFLNIVSKIKLELKFEVGIPLNECNKVTDFFFIRNLTLKSPILQ